MDKGESPVVKNRKCRGEGWRLTRCLAQESAGLCNGWDGGREERRAAEQKRTLWNNMSMGKRLASASRTSPAAVLSEPVTSLAILRWTRISFLMTVTELNRLLLSDLEKRPVYQISAA